MMTRALHLGTSWTAVMRGIYLFTPMWVGALLFSSIVIAQSVETRSTDDDIQHLDRERIIPNDPYFSYQQVQAEMIHLPEAWSLTTGSADVVVAVIDSGEGNHPDLDKKWVDGYDFLIKNGMMLVEKGYPMAFM